MRSGKEGRMRAGSEERGMKTHVLVLHLVQCNSLCPDTHERRCVPSHQDLSEMERRKKKKEKEKKKKKEKKGKKRQR